MKKYLFAALGAGLLMTSCQSDEPLAPGNGLEQQVAFTVSLPDAVSTRAGGTNSAAGGVSNNMNEDVTFNVALYLDGRLVFADNKTVQSTGNYTSATFEPTLVIGENYQLVAFAEFDDDATATGEGKTPATNMGLIAMESGINNEKNDEYFVTTTVTAAPKLSAELKRPYGKLRLIAEDLAEAERQFGAAIESVKVKYEYTRPTNFNVIAGTFNPVFTAAEQTFEAPYGVYGADTDASRTIFVDYIPGKFDGSDVMMPFTIEVKFANGKTYTRSFTQDIPVRRNWLTTLKGHLFTMDSELKLTIEENFDGETNIDVWEGNSVEPTFDATTNTYRITSAGELLWISENASTIQSIKNLNIVLANNISLQNLEWKPINLWNPERPATIDGNGYTIEGLKITAAGNGSGLFGSCTLNAKNLTIKNVNIDKPSGNFVGALCGSLYGDIENVNVENVKINTGGISIRCGGIVGIHNGGNATNCTATNVEVTAYHNVGGISGTVNETNNRVYTDCVVKNGKFVATGNAPYAGAITGNANGVKLTLKGCSQENCVPEQLVGMGAENVTNYNVLANGNYYTTIDEAINAGAKAIKLTNANYGTVTAGVMKDVTIEGSENSVMIFKTDANTEIENVTLKNVNFEYTGATADCGVVIDANAQIDNLVVDGCAFTGTGAKAGRGISGQNTNATIVVRNTTFKNLGYPIYAWGSYKNLTVEGCTFEGIKSWAIMPQSGFDGNLTVNGNKFVNCVGGLVKAGTLTAGHTFTFTNNVITNSAEHPSRNWFEFKTSAGTKVVEGNTKDGAAWTPGDAEGLK